MKVVLTIAGTDPSGAAGIQVDLQTMRDHECHGVSVITSVLAQNTQGVRELLPMPPGFVASQLEAVLDDFDVAAVKVGLVPNDEVLDIIAGRLSAPVVWDPVLASGDGDVALFSGTTSRLRDVATAATVITPNIPELEALTGTEIDSRADAHHAAATLSTVGCAVLLKVGHLDSEARRVASQDPRAILPPETLSDIWAEDGDSFDLAGLFEISDDVRGTGCQLSTALACNLAHGTVARDAAEAARAYLNELLFTKATQLGRGRFLIVR